MNSNYAIPSPFLLFKLYEEKCALADSKNYPSFEEKHTLVEEYIMVGKNSSPIIKIK